MTFTELGLIDPILKALQQEGYTQPTPIQAQAIPYLLEGKDILGCAQTGTGKTAAFSIPILQHLYAIKIPSNAPPKIRALILTPTRELAIQIEDSLKAYGRYTGLKHLVIFGGVSQHAQTRNLQEGIDILVATPGRLLDLMQQGFIHLQHVQHFVLDEADRMLDMGFVNDVKKVLTKLPAKRQNLLFSATMPKEIVQLASTFLHQPVQVSVTPVSSTAETVQQTLYFVDTKNKRHLLKHLIQQHQMSSVLVFTRTKHGADKVVKELVKEGIQALAIHGNKSQNARQMALKLFKDGKLPVLVATDIAARGIDIDALGHVINFEIPNIAETYVHRIGRTGRAGTSGLSYSFVDQEEQAYLKDIQKLIGKSIPVEQNHPWHINLPAQFSKPPLPQKSMQNNGKPWQSNRPPMGNTGYAKPQHGAVRYGRQNPGRTGS